MTAELILTVTATVFVIAAVVVTYGLAPLRRTPFIFDLLNETFGRASPRGLAGESRASQPPGQPLQSKRAVLPARVPRAKVQAVVRSDAEREIHHCPGPRRFATMA